jgi:hypothetical protein
VPRLARNACLCCSDGTEAASKKKRKADGSDDEGDEDSDEAPAKRKPKAKRNKKAESDVDKDDDEEHADDKPSASKKAAGKGTKAGAKEKAGKADAKDDDPAMEVRAVAIDACCTTRRAGRLRSARTALVNVQVLAADQIVLDSKQVSFPQLHGVHMS